MLLMMTPLEMKVMSAYQWQNMSLGGLKTHELRGLAFALSKAGSVRRYNLTRTRGCTPMCCRLQPCAWFYQGG